MDEENNQDVPIEEVNKVIEESNKETTVEEDSSETSEEYKDLTEEEAEKELKEMIVPEKTDETKQEKINMSLLQFQCSECGFKIYCNLEDNVANPLPEPIKCINCGKKKAIKKRIFNITINDYKDIEKKEETVEEEVAKE